MIDYIVLGLIAEHWKVSSPSPAGDLDRVTFRRSDRQSATMVRNFRADRFV